MDPAIAAYLLKKRPGELPSDMEPAGSPPPVAPAYDPRALAAAQEQANQLYAQDRASQRVDSAAQQLSGHGFRAQTPGDADRPVKAYLTQRQQAREEQDAANKAAIQPYLMRKYDADAESEQGRMDLARQQHADQVSHQDAQLAQQRQHQLEQLGVQREEVGLRRSTVEQDAWKAIADPVTGGVVMYNGKTGEVRPLGPGGGKPGELPRPKPKDLENDVQSLGKDLEPIAKATPDLQTLESYAGNDDVPGFGPVEGRIPSMLVGSDGVAARQAAGRIMAAIIQMTSGTAASEKEVERLLEAQGIGRTATPEQFRQGVSKLRAQYETLTKQREAKYHPSVVSTYGERGGFTAVPPPPSKRTGGKVKMIDPKGKVWGVPANKVEEAKSHGWKEG